MVSWMSCSSEAKGKSDRWNRLLQPQMEIGRENRWNRDEWTIQFA